MNGAEYRIAHGLATCSNSWNCEQYTFDVAAAAAHVDAISSVESAGVQELERVDEERAQAVPATNVKKFDGCAQQLIFESTAEVVAIGWRRHEG